MMKLLLDDMRGVLTDVLKLTDGQSHGYLLAIFENDAASTKAETEVFDLLNLRPLIISDE